MTLKERLVALIEAGGPMPVSAYMTACLHDPVGGYYATRPGVGTDFTTAPETSQMFGELIGLWAAHAWQTMGAPETVTLAELGPGRGTMMADVLRAGAHMPGFSRAACVTLVEASPALRALQADKLATRRPAFVDAPGDIPDGPALILANEYLDCLPARQFVADGSGWHERVVGRGPDGDLAFGLAVDKAPDVPSGVSGAVEVQPGLETLVDALAARTGPWRALFVDYGPVDRAPGDTLRAYRAGVQCHPLEAPGDCDLTVDVDFGRLTRLASRAGLDVAGPLTQGAFLGALGLQARLDVLIRAQPGEAERLFAGAQTLVDPAQMGTRFKAICISSPGLPAPAGFQSARSR